MSGVSKRDLARLIELLHDNLAGPARAQLEARLRKEPALAAAYAKMQAARRACGVLGSADPPTPSWRELETQLHWRLAREDEPREAAQPRRAWIWRWSLGLGAAAALGIVLGVVITRDAGRRSPAATHAKAPTTRHVTPAPVAPTVREMAALAVYLRGEVKVLPVEGSGIAPLSLQRPLVAGDRLLTGRASAAILQWQPGTGVKVHAGGELALSRLTTADQELRLFGGEAFFELERGPDQQRMVVIAGPLRVEVVGTSFSLRLGNDYAELTVDHGKVRAVPIDEKTLAVRGEAVIVEAGHRLRISRQVGHRVDHPRRKEIEPRRPGLYLTPWRGLHRVLASTGVLDIRSSPAGASLRLDGKGLGSTNARLRAAAGRHLVELYRHGQLVGRRWVEVGIGLESGVNVQIEVKEPRTKVAAKQAPPADPGATSIHELFRRRAPLIRSCYQRRARRQPGLAGKVVLRMRIDAEGQARRIDIAKNTMGESGVAECVRAMVRTWVFPRGQAATVTYPFVFSPR